MKHILKPVFLLCLLAKLNLAQAQTIRYVRPTTAGIGNGSSWNNAGADLQTMINASGNNDQVWVAAGIYKPATGTNRSFDNAVCLLPIHCLQMRSYSINIS